VRLDPTLARARVFDPVKANCGLLATEDTGLEFAAPPVPVPPGADGGVVVDVMVASTKYVLVEVTVDCSSVVTV
jgi:hypothetical protein